MARVAINEATWTEVGAAAATYLIQNVNGHRIFLYFGTPPAVVANVEEGFTLKPGDTASPLGALACSALGVGFVEAQAE